MIHSLASRIVAGAFLACVGGATGARGDLLYVSGQDGVSVVDPEAGKVVAVIPTGSVDALALSLDGRSLYATSADPNAPLQIAVIDTRSRENWGFIETAAQPYAIVEAFDGSLWVSQRPHCRDGACAGEYRLDVFHPEWLESVATVKGFPFGPVVFGSGGETAYAVSTPGSAIVALDTASFEVIATLPSICCVSSNVIVVHPDGHTVYALGNEFGGFVAIADLRSQRSYATYRFIVGQEDDPPLDFQWGIAFSQDGKRAYLPGRHDAPTLFVLNTEVASEPKLIRSVPLRFLPHQIAVSADGESVYLTNQEAASIEVMDVESGSVRRTIALGSVPRRIVAARPTLHCDLGEVAPLEPYCPADCDADGKVVVHELVRALNVALGGGLSRCSVADLDRNQRVSVDELIAAVDVALHGCHLPGPTFAGRMHLDVETRSVGGEDVAVRLNMVTVSKYPCFNYEISNAAQVGEEGIVIVLGCAVPHPEICPLLGGPARAGIDLTLPYGSHSLELRSQVASDFYVLEVGPGGASLTAVLASFSRIGTAD